MKPGKKGKRTRGFGSPPHLLEACRLLAESGAKYLIVGGVACNLHGLARATKDLDVLIPKDIENTEKILEALSHLTWRIAREVLPEEVIKKPFTIIGDMPRVDLLLRAGKIQFEDSYPRRVVKTIDGIKFPFACLSDLIASKDTGRPIDALEVRELRAIRRFRSRGKK